MTGSANLLTVDIELYLGTANCLPKIDVQRIFQIRAPLRLWRGLFRTATREELVEYIAEAEALVFTRVRASLRAPCLLCTHIVVPIETVKMRSAGRSSAI